MVPDRQVPSAPNLQTSQYCHRGPRLYSEIYYVQLYRYSQKFWVHWREIILRQTQVYTGIQALQACGMPCLLLASEHK